MGEAAHMRTIVSAKAITLPGGGDVHLIAPPPKPCVTILVHGVNDLAGCYAHIENGLCAGLNERLDMPQTLPGGANNPGFLTAAAYSLPLEDDGKASDPDAVYYRRKFSASNDGSATRSVVVPFYWGFREEEASIKKHEPHGEWLDRNNNRLDKTGTKEGGQFANATTNLPDMWGKGFNGMLFGFIPIDKIGGSTTHPLFSAPGRRYMILAAMRLAMLIKIIRQRYPNDTINIVGHSQGTLLTLLAHAFLKDEGVKAADGVVMLNSPYSLFEPFTESFQTRQQQTTAARIATLKGILDFIATSPNPSPALSSVALKNCSGYGAIGGPGWTGGAGSETNIRGKKVVFNERDNRGCTFLYFTPQDQTVGLGNVQGMGWRGIGDSVNKQPARTILTPRFHQRVFTLRKRDGQKEDIGLHTPPYIYPLILPGEKTWEDTGLGLKSRILEKASFDKGERVVLTAAQLPVPAKAVFSNEGSIMSPGEDSPSGVYQVKDKLDPIDAAIAVSNKGWNSTDTRYARHEHLDEATAFKYGRDVKSVERSRNEDKETAQQAHVFTVRPITSGEVLITRGETPYEARLRYQSEAYQEALSFHSSIPNNAEHSREVLAYDIAIGAGESVDDMPFYEYLCRVADWRIDWKNTRGKIFSSGDAETDQPDEELQDLYRVENELNRGLINDTILYRITGVLTTRVDNNIPSAIALQSLDERKAGLPIRFGGHY
ncbi:effector protein Tle3 domain-containing protein [Pseudomonas weihenstephanensis]|uniref:T6SS effector phospholipase Tle3 domain-containing protein n=1 Tax=Pseudomonas weihenstephanensis TaxID=1608994 RepID=UPI00193B37E7|nr:DUF3274 domain-containing protein [Pseudomonas weihenstephanensis]MBM1191427.1 DUF3274 domain-containing protein [Pseudomonas weihenstephanensis]